MYYLYAYDTVESGIKQFNLIELDIAYYGIFIYLFVIVIFLLMFCASHSHSQYAI